MTDKNIIFEKKNDTLSAFHFQLEKDENELLNQISPDLLRHDLDQTQNCSENEVVRHFIRLSKLNYGVDSGFYPLGSCTMKYNPKINEKIMSDESFTGFHPYSDAHRIQGNLEIIYQCQETLKEITAMDDISLAPCAGAHGELTGLYIIKAYFDHKKEDRPYILIPDAAHGTNPASASMGGFKVITVKSDAQGYIDIDDLKEKASSQIAVFMLTNPNTLGIFERNIAQIEKICHEKDIQLYYDGANLNAILGISRPGDTGFDVVHLNLHKTFSTPHGGGGPGAGPVGVKKHLTPFLPNEEVVLKDLTYQIKPRSTLSIGKVRTFYTNFLVISKAYIYMTALGGDGLRNSGFISLLNANYLAGLLEDVVEVASKPHIMHEFVISLSQYCKRKPDQVQSLTVMDFAKRILDHGFHAPTVSFPLIVPDCLMIEPTETETRQTLDSFAAALKAIIREAVEEPQKLFNSPQNTPVQRVDEVLAARNPILKYEK